MTRLSRIVSLGCLCVLLAAKPSQSAEGERLIRSEIVCENDIWDRKCLNRSVLSIETVDYKLVTGSYICNRNNSVQGNPCPSVEKTSLVKNSCNGKNQCNLSAERSILGNPCPGRVETAASIYLEIFFACVEPASTTSPTTQPRKPTSKKPRVSSASVSETLSTSATTANPDSSDVIKSPEPFSGQTTSSKYRKPQPCTTKREIITFNPDNEPAISEGSSQLRGLQNAQVMFVIALLLMACQAFCMSD